MVNFKDIQIQEQVYPDPDYENLDIIKINPQITPDDCRRIISMLRQNNKSTKFSDQNEEVIEIINSKSLPPKYESINKSEIVKKPRLDHDKSGEKIESTIIPSCSKPVINARNPVPKKFEKDKNETMPFPSKPPANNSSKISQESQMAFQVIYGRHKPYKKNKEWTFDGYLTIKPEGLTLYKTSGVVESRSDNCSDKTPKYFSIGTQLIIGQWECEICEKISFSEFESGFYFIPDDI